MPPPLELNVSQPLPVEDSRHASPPVIYIKRSRGLVSLRLGELWQYRELVYFLAWRDVKVRHTDRAGRRLGCRAAFLHDGGFSLFFGRLPRCPPTVSYPLFAIARSCRGVFFQRSEHGVEQSGRERESDSEGNFHGSPFQLQRCSRAGWISWCVSVARDEPTTDVDRGRVAAIAPSAGLVTALGVSLWLSALNVRIATCDTRSRF
jgi:hypothetical protein